MSVFPRLLAATAAMHAADQITLAALPLIAIAAGADARAIGLLVAAQSAAWLLLSLPIGALADRLSRRTLMQAGAVAAMAGSLLGLLAVQTSGAWLLALACFVTAGGVVVIVLSVFTLLPRAVATKELPRANARLELARAVVTLAAPAPTAWLAAHGMGALAFAATAICGALALIACRALPRDAAATKSLPMLTAIRDGARFVAGHIALRAVALCAVFWNMAFFALAALFAPFATAHLGFDAQTIGRVWSALGAGLVIGALAAPALSARVQLAALLIFGPVVSVAAIVIIAASPQAPNEFVLWFAFFLLGFGPMIYAVTQTSLRQQITPPDMMGRVGATIQAANYGARPVGALIAGWVGARFGVGNAMLFPALLFIASFASMAVLLRAAVAAVEPAR